MKRKYNNPYINNIRRNIIDFLRWKLGHYYEVDFLSNPPDDFVYPRADRDIIQEEPKLEWINHCTFLIEIDGVRILTDPIWSFRCSPFKFFGPKRRHPPARELEELPSIDMVLISHNHYDHLDRDTVDALHILYPDLLWIIPKGVKSWFAKRGIFNVKEVVWWEEFVINMGCDKPEITVVGVPAQHNSGRTCFDINKSLWLGYVVRFTKRFDMPSKHFYFVGDTAYNPYDFKKIGQTFEKIDLCMCPIGTYAPGDFMRTVHSHPEDAVRIHQDVNAELSVGMHWHTFKLSEEPMNRPPYDLFLEMVKRDLNPERFIPLNPGEVINW